ncbi:MAG: hypothetical protein ACRDXX_01035 [Stackebrandtia sp.]
MSLPESLVAVAFVAADVPNPAPEDPTSGSKAISLLISYVKSGVLIACGISAVVSGGMMAAGSLTSRPDSVDRGKRALIWSLGGVIVAAIAIPVTNSIFGATN